MRRKTKGQSAHQRTRNISKGILVHLLLLVIGVGITLGVSAQSVQDAGSVRNQFNTGNLAIAQTGQASSQRFEIDLPRQNLALSLKQLAQQTGQQLLFSHALAEQQTAQPAVGRYTLQQAVSLLLKGTGLSSVYVEGVLTIVDAEALLLLSQWARPDQHKIKGEGKMNRTAKKNILAGTIAFLMAGSQGVSAQDASSAEEQYLLDEIIVTATKRETNLQETGMSISVVSGKKLEELGIVNFTDVVSSLPSVTLIDSGPGNRRIILRGINATHQLLPGHSTTASYLGDYALGFGTADIKMVDMARLELLKGPQGTLWGQSAMGGVLRYIPNEPNSEAFSGGINTYVSNTAHGGDNYGGHGYVNIPIADNLAARLVAYQYDNDGFIDDLGTGIDNVNTEETTGGRLAVKWDISDTMAFDLTYLNQSRKVGGRQIVMTTYDEDLVPIEVDHSNPQELTQDRGAREIRGDDLEMLNLKFSVEFDRFTLDIMGARREAEGFSIIDVREFVGLHGVGAVPQRVTSKGRTDTAEIRLVSKSGGDWDWIVGGWHKDTVNSGTLYTTWGELVAQDSGGRGGNGETALYGEISRHFSEKTTLTLGYRAADVEHGSEQVYANGPFDGPVDPVDFQEDVETYKINLEHQYSDDILAYILATSGYRRGGVNVATINRPQTTYGSDSLWNYELGVKTVWLDNRLTVNAAIYRIDWDDMQLSLFNSDTNATSTRNAKKAIIDGIEIETIFQVTEALNLSFNYSYNDAKMGEDFYLSATRLGGGEGDRLQAQAPENYSFIVDYRQSVMPGYDLLASAHYTYVDTRYDRMASHWAGDRAITLPSYEIVNLRLGLSHESGVDVSLFADNVFDELAVFHTDGATHQRVGVNKPRTVGLNVSYDF